MSKIGNKPISIPSGVTVEVQGNDVVVRGTKGEQRVHLQPNITVNVEANQVLVIRANDDQQTKAFHGLVRSLINNSVEGVSKGYSITLKLIGTGYRVAAKGAALNLSLGFSHPVEFPAEKGVTFKVEGNDTIVIEGIDKHSIGQVAANIRKIRPPEPYKGKGIRYVDEVVIRKAGKTAGK
jgi:large subunit ribosomal protein L6